MYEYEIYTTKKFDTWLSKLKDLKGKAVFCLLGGDKSTQANDISLVKRMVEPEVKQLFEELDNEI